MGERGAAERGRDEVSCLTPETIAAFAEGRLAGEERARVVAHLADCDECRAILAGTLEVLAELEGAPRPVEAPAPGPALARSAVATPPAAAGGPPLDAPRRWWGGARLSWPLLAAAALALAVTAAVASRLLVPPAPPRPAEWLAEQRAPAELVPHLWGGVVLRGEEERELRRAGAEVGALLVDLEVALAAGDGDVAAELAHRLAAVFAQAGLLDAEAAALRAAADAGDPGRLGLRRLLPDLQGQARARFEPFWIDAGAFAEQVRVTALAGDDPLAARAPRRYLDWLLEQDREELPAPAREALTELAAATEPPGRAAAAARLLAELTR